MINHLKQTVLFAAVSLFVGASLASAQEGSTK